MHTINYILHNTQLYDQKPPQPRCRCARHNADADVFAGMGWSVVTWRRWLKVVNNLVKRAEGLPFAAICSRWNTYIGFRCSLLVWAVVVSNPTRWTLSIIFGVVYGSSISSLEVLQSTEKVQLCTRAVVCWVAMFDFCQIGGRWAPHAETVFSWNIFQLSNMTMNRYQARC